MKIARLTGFLFLSAALAWLLFGASCSTDDKAEKVSYTEAIAKGKEHLENNEGDEAVKTFRYAQDLDADPPDAHFGLLLAQTMGLVNLLDTLLGMFDELFDVIGGADPNAPREVGPPAGAALQDLLNRVIGVPFGECETSFEYLAPGPEFTFELSSYELSLSGQPLLALGGDFNKTDAYWLGAVIALFSAVSDIAQANNLDFDLYTLLNNLDLSALDFTNDPMGSLAYIADLLDSLINDPYYPDFLTLLPDVGVEHMQSAGVNLGRVFGRVYGSLNHLAEDAGRPSSSQLTYADANGNDSYDPDIDSVRLGDLLMLDPELVEIISQLSWDLRNVLWEGSPDDVNPLKVDRLTLAMFNDLLIYLGLLDSPLLPNFIGFNIGRIFTDPSPTGLKDLLQLVVDLIYQLAEIN